MSTYYRCSNCRGFYETGLPQCKYCGYSSAMNGADGLPVVFPNRAMCRAIQIAEYEQLPPEAMTDSMRPPADELPTLCYCLHCGDDGPRFEAVEMRWLADEKMWACPNTTCGGRGFDMDVYPVAPRWECRECGKKWAPPGGNSKPSNCKCPVCGCVSANGWFQDEYSEEEIEAMTEQEFVAYFGKTRAEQEADYQRFNEEFDARQKASLDGPHGNDLLDEPWDDLDALAP